MSSIRELDQETLSEMSMVDIAYHILKENNKEPKAYLEILGEITKMKGLTDEQKQIAMARLYTEINIDGRFKALGNNVWGLRSWYPVEQAEEIVITETKAKKKKKKKMDDNYLEDDLDDLEVYNDEELDDVEDLDDFEDDEEIDDDLDDDNLGDDDLDDDNLDDDDLDNDDLDDDNLDDENLDPVEEDLDEDLDELDDSIGEDYDNDLELDETDELGNFEEEED